MNYSGVGSIALLSMLAAGGCSVIVDANRSQCSTDKDCTARGVAFADSVCVDSFCQTSSKWACLSDARPVVPTGNTFKVSFTVREIVKQQPLAGVTGRLCRKLDVACSDALSADVTSDAQGTMLFDVPSAFDGYVRFEGTDISPTLHFFNPPVAKDLNNLSVSLASPTTIGLLALQAGAQQSDDRGLVLLSVVDCTGAPTAGVKLSAQPTDSKSVSFYAQQGLPSGIARETDSSGYGGFLNTTPGSVTFSAQLASTGRVIDQVTVLVQPNTATVTTLVPHGG